MEINHLYSLSYPDILVTIESQLEALNQKLNQNARRDKEIEYSFQTWQSMEYKHRQNLQNLLIEALAKNDLQKANIITGCLRESAEANYYQLNRHVSVPSTSPYINEETKSPLFMGPFINNAATSSLSMTPKSCLTPRYNVSEHEFDESSELNTSDHCLTKDDDVKFIENSGDIESSKENSLQELFGRTKKMIPISPIRHLICSPGLEKRMFKSKMVIMFRGMCKNDCYRNKPWCSKEHIHYIVNTAHCNDHISRIVKKQGVQFYNSFVIQDKERIRQIIRFYNMEPYRPEQD